METPAWFTEALAREPEHKTVEVDGAKISYRAWGRSGDPAAVLVHGGAAHAGWWDHIGPHLTAHHRVISIDLSGHGDSDWRSEYTLGTWAREIMAAAGAEGSDGPVLFGHSMGGFVSLMASRLYDSLAGVVAIDSPVRESSAETKAWAAERRQLPGTKVYDDRDEILSRFRTLPEDASGLAFVRDHLAQGSVRQTAGGWSWKFDPQIFLRSRMEPEEVREANCPVALLRGERGMASTDINDVVAERLGIEVPVTVIVDAGHHIMIDQPVALLAVLQTFLGQWRTR